MAKERTLTFDQIKTLFNFSGGVYSVKREDSFAEAFSALFKGTNKNDKPFTTADIKKQPLIKDFNFKGVNDFTYICKLKGQPIEIKNNSEWKNERIVAFDFADDKAKEIFNKSLGLVYIITCEIGEKEHIVKIGCSRTTFKDRLGSYNCGTVNAWRTASTTNIKMLQSFVACNVDFKLYILDCKVHVATYKWHDAESKPFASSTIYAYEDILIDRFRRQFGQIPLANVQSNATEV